MDTRNNSDKLVIAYRNIAFQNAENQKCATELRIANKTLVFQNNEKEKREAELVTANKELVFQNKEKEKRAVELITINNELEKSKVELLRKYKEISDYKHALDEACIVEITDQHGIIKFVNDNFCRISKYSKEELIGRHHRIVNSGFHSEEFIKNKLTTLENGKVWKGEIKNKAKDGTYYWVDTTIVPFLNASGQPYQFLSIRADITKRKETEERIMQSEVQIRNFAKHLNHVQEEERAHIAREIHDELGQELVGIKIGLSFFKKNSVSSDKTTGLVKGMLDGIDNAIQSLRKIATQLRPGILDSLGLIPSIEWLGKEFERKTGISCEIDVPLQEERFEKNISICFFRICQESLTNISKHAEPDKIKIRLSCDKNELNLTISDDGKGMSDEKLKNPFSMGLLGMRERAGNVGGDLIITSKKNKGTTIQLKVPLN